jgi:hypothetical protein
VFKGNKVVYASVLATLLLMVSCCNTKPLHWTAAAWLLHEVDTGSHIYAASVCLSV